MPVRPSSVSRSPLAPIAAALLIVVLGVGQVRAMWQAVDPVTAELGDPAGHLVVSELLTGAASASDEFVELYNPTTSALPLEGLELIYVTASGATVTRKAAWAVGAPSVPSGGHLLIANEAGAYAAIADVTYASGLAATGGSIALRIQGASTAIDAVGWGNAVSTWLEGTVAPAPAAGSSLERLPGGVAGNFQDTDDNVIDFTVRTVPNPQNSNSPITPAPSPSLSATPSPTSEATPSATVAPTATLPATPSPTPPTTPTPTAEPTQSPTTPPTPTPSPTPRPLTTIADARLLPDGSSVTLHGMTLTDSAFTDGGGYLADASGGIAVLLGDGAFGRGREIEVTGVLDTRYQQRTLRAGIVDIDDLGTGSEPTPLGVATGNVGEGTEAVLVRIEGEIVSSATVLASGTALDVDDGSGATRVLLMTSTGLDTAAWIRGTMVTVVGVVGQRDATGTGSSGYRVQPRDAADVSFPPPPPTPSPSPMPSASNTPAPTATPAPTSSPTPTPSAGVPLTSIAEARSAATGASVRVRGVVTLADGLIDPVTAVIQDPSAAIVLRLSDEAGSLRLGQLVEVSGKRSTKSGMLTIRVSDQPLQLGTQAEPDAARTSTSALGEDLESRLVVTRGALTGAPRRSSAGSISFAIDDGSGEVRVVAFAGSGIDLGAMAGGTWIEVRGVLGQDTTGSQPLRGYRVWPRSGSDLSVLGQPPAAAGGTGSAHPTPPPPRQPSPGAVRLTRLHTADPLAPPATEAPIPSTRRGTGSNEDEIASAADPLAMPTGRREPRDPLTVTGVLALALAALAGLSFVAWRDGAFARLGSLVRSRGAAMASDEADSDAVTPASEASAGELLAPLPRLSVIRVPHEQSGP